MKTLQVCTRALVVGLCLIFGACGGGDDGSGPPNGEDDTYTESSGDDNDNGSSSNQQSQQESECSSSSECEFVVCDCAEGPVNFQGCSVVNGVGTCATEDTCARSACD